MIDLAISEFLKDGELPGLDQLAAHSISIVYRIMVRISNTLPNLLKNRFLMNVILLKFYEIFPEQEAEFLSILEDIKRYTNSESAENPYERLKDIAQKYPNALSHDLHLDSSAIKFFVENPLYKDSRLPHTVIVPYKLLLYAAVRIDLIQSLIPELLSEMLGYRFIYIPPPVLRLVTNFEENSPNNRPIIIAYDEDSPLMSLKLECEQMSIPFEIIEPLIIGQIGKDKKEIEMKSNVRPIIQALYQNSVMKK